jgi:hypothetical protein
VREAETVKKDFNGCAGIHFAGCKLCYLSYADAVARMGANPAAE